jgi:hypothetical protein
MDTQQEIPKFIKLWIKALRSGKYRQTTECLQDDLGYCCLGVAIDISGLPVLKTENGFIIGEFLPKNVIKFFNLLNSEGKHSTSDEHCLAHLNDNKKWSFNKIADYLELNWRYYVKTPD